MTEKVILSIKGLQFDNTADEEPIEVITAGNYYKRNGKHYVVYEEVTEGFAETTKNIVKINESMLDITKKGATNVHMIFEEDKKNLTCYNTPYGSILIGIAANEVEVKEGEENIDILVRYALEVNYEHLADCVISMNIKSRGAGDFSLTTES